MTVIPTLKLLQLSIFLAAQYTRIMKDRKKHQERIDTGSKRPGRKPKLTNRAERYVNKYSREPLHTESLGNLANSFISTTYDGTCSGKKRALRLY